MKDWIFKCVALDNEVEVLRVGENVARGYEWAGNYAQTLANKVQKAVTYSFGEGGAECIRHPRKKGRPAGTGKTNAERQAAFRARHVLVPLGEQMSATIRRYADDFDLTQGEVIKELIRFALTNNNWKDTGF